MDIYQVVTTDPAVARSLAVKYSAVVQCAVSAVEQRLYLTVWFIVRTEDPRGSNY